MVQPSRYRSALAHPATRKFLRYLVVGGLAALLDWALFPLFLYGLGLHYLVAATLSFVLATAFNYLLSIRWVFLNSRFSRRQEILLVYGVSAVGIVINLTVLWGMIELVALHPMIAKIAGTATAFGWNFMARYLWVFAR